MLTATAGTGTGAPPAAGANPLAGLGLGGLGTAATGGLGGLGVQGGGDSLGLGMDPAQLAQVMQNPLMQQIIQQTLSNPQYIQQVGTLVPQAWSC